MTHETDEILTAYHRKQSNAACAVVSSLLKQPVSLEEARLQVQQISAQSRSAVKKGQTSMS